MKRTALGHIIKAEGEKIQKAKALSIDNEGMFKINESVEDMIKEIIKFEMVLHFKLGLCENALCVPNCPFPQRMK